MSRPEAAILGGSIITTVLSALRHGRSARRMISGSGFCAPQLARQAEAEREKRAKIIATDGEYQAAQVLANAAEIISTQPAALALRYMQTLLDMGSNQNSTIVFPIPIELIRPLLAAPVPMKKAVSSPPPPEVPGNGVEHKAV